MAETYLCDRGKLTRSRTNARRSPERLVGLRQSAAPQWRQAAHGGRVYAFRPTLRGEHSDMAVSAILREIGIIGGALDALPESAPRGTSSSLNTSVSTKPS
jgi:hypothetical protein